MAKTRVYELARDLNIESKVLMNILKTVGAGVASHQSTLSDEQIDLVHKAMKGEITAPTTRAKPVAVKSGGGRTIIRRRRRAAEEAESKAEEAPQEAESAQPSHEGGVAEAEESEQTASTLEMSEESKSEMNGGSTPAVAAEAQLSSTDPEPEAQEEMTPRRRRQQAGGATIVRKASPEEVEQRRAAQEKARRPSARKEDSRGTKYTGVGSQKQETPILDVPLDETGKPSRRSGKDKDKRHGQIPETEEEIAIAKKITAKQKRAGITMRDLLNQIEPDDEETVETPYGIKAKTVYTPNAAQRRRDLKRRKDLKKTEITIAKAEKRVVRMGDEILVGEFAKQLKVKAPELMKKLMDQGVMATINEPVDFDTACLIAAEYNYEVKTTTRTIEDILGTKSGDVETTGTETRPPIVTVMGHVDHGKTSILDAIRQTEVATGEAGGITQHIGAYAVVHNGKKIAFLDTPGHEAFSSMRARGANATDIVVLVVAADDGVMPQTVEAISHAKDAGVPIIVAVNKMDKENTNIDRIYTELSEHEIQSEEWGGETQFIKVSALTKMGIEDLLEAIVLQAEVLELKTSSEIPAEGVVVEAHLDQGRGPIATVMVKHGTLKTGDFLVAGFEFGRVRAMHDHHGVALTEAGPSTPVEILGLSGVPDAGDRVNSVEDEKTARGVVDWRRENVGTASEKSSAQSLEDLLGRMQSEGTPEMPIIIKGDTQGSVEAICESLEKLNSERVRNKVVHKAVGGISESDITLAEASSAVVIGFNVRAARGLDDVAEKRGVPVEYFSVIYDLVDSVKNLMAGKLPPIREEVVIGKAEVRQPISVPKIGTIAGSAVLDGKITRSSSLRLIRDEIVIYDGRIGSLRRFKDDVKEVKSGYECGIGFENYNDVKIGDVIEAYEVHESRPTL